MVNLFSPGSEYDRYIYNKRSNMFIYPADVLFFYLYHKILKTVYMCFVICYLLSINHYELEKKQTGFFEYLFSVQL